MDPNANLREQRALVAEILDEHTPLDDPIATAEALAALVQSLDEWLVSGGFQPYDWRYGRVKAMRRALGDDREDELDRRRRAAATYRPEGE